MRLYETFSGSAFKNIPWFHLTLAVKDIISASLELLGSPPFGSNYIMSLKCINIFEKISRAAFVWLCIYVVLRASLGTSLKEKKPQKANDTMIS